MKMFKTIGSKRSFLLAALLVAIMMLLFLFWDDESREYAEVSHTLLQLKEMDARLDRDVLRVTSFMLVQYDPLVQTSWRLKELRHLLQDATAHQDEEFHALMSIYWQGMDDKLAILEKIKFQAALVRNGIHYLPIVSRELSAIEPEAYQKVLELLNMLYTYELFYTDSQLDEIRDMLTGLEHLPLNTHEGAEILEKVLFHVNSNLDDLTALGQWKSQYLAVPSLEYFENIHSHHEESRITEMKHKRELIIVLSLMVFVLVLGLWLLIHSLQRAHHEVNRSWHRLHDAVENLSEAFALFDGDGLLVLHNRRFLTFYPWLKDWLEQGIDLNAIKAATGGRVRSFNQEGEEIIGSLPKGQFMEQVDNDTWYLASNVDTSEGGVVCVRSDVTASKRAEADLRKLSRVLEQSPASVVITNTDGIIEYVNPKFEQVSGYTSAEALGQNPRFLKSGDKSQEEYDEMWGNLLAGKEWRGLFHNRRKDGTIYWESASISPLRDERGRITHFIAIKEDITAQKRAEDQLRMNTAVFETTTEGIMVTDEENLIKTINPAFTRITGFTQDEVQGRSPSVLSSGRHDRGFYEKMWESVLQKGYWTGEIWNRRKDGSVYPEWLSISTIRDDNGIVREHVAVFSDITKYKQDEEQILYQANYDALTGLPNRSLLSDRLSQAIVAAQRESWMLAVLFVDLNHFKIVNDTFGHVVGDEVLQMVAGRIKSCLRESDTVARFGGDEFIILLQDVTEMDSVAHIATNIINSTTRVITLYGREIYIGASIGITVYPDDAENVDSLLRNADMAMYQAKERGRNTYQFFTASMQQHTLVRQQLELDLRQAIQREELEIFYQPVVDARENRVVSVEALLRWHHPIRGMVSPAIFIPLAEDTGQIGPIGEWVMRGACEQLKQWHRAGFKDLKMAVNLSSRQRELGLQGEFLKELLQETGLSSDYLTLEMTESLLMRDTEEAMTWLTSFKDLGIKLSVDDFGTGYSSLSYLKRFPMDVLKIDRSFVSDLPDNLEDATLVNTIVAMADSLKMRVIAEGVETRQQVEFLLAAGCNELQGFYFAKPMKAENLTAWLNGDLRETGTS